MACNCGDKALIFNAYLKAGLDARGIRVQGSSQLTRPLLEGILFGEGMCVCMYVRYVLLCLLLRMHVFYVCMCMYVLYVCMYACMNMCDYICVCMYYMYECMHI